ncbi:MAG TPA: glycosyltransferase [Caulobacteraceae bacterium]
MSGRPKVLHLIDNLGMGGAETWLIALLRHWGERGEAAPQTEFLATSGQPGFYDDEARSLGAVVHYVRYGRDRLPQFIGDFRRILRHGRYAALHDHQDFTSGWHFLMGAGLLPPVRITHVHNQYAHIAANYLTSPSRRRAAAVGRSLISRYGTYVAGTSAQSLRDYAFDRLKGPRGPIPSGPIYCGFDPARFAGDAQTARAVLRGQFGWPAETRVVLFVGRVDDSPDLGHPLNQKNSGFAADVAIRLARQDKSVRCLFVGNPGGGTPVLQGRVCAAGLAGRIVFAGRRRDVDTLMLGADVLLFPSQTEGLGMVAVEAQAAGLPVLASTAVPRECVVVPSLVQFKDVADGAGAWAAALGPLIDQPRDRAAANRSVAASPYAIASSAAALEVLYAGGARP